MAEPRHRETGTSSAELRTPDVELSGLFDLLGRHLYSTPAVAVRELVQNAHDSIVRRRLADPDYGGGEIHLVSDHPRSVLVVDDDGAGLTADEVVRDLATIGRGGTRAVREAAGSDELIGLFGIGFLSAFVVAHTVTVTTTSWREPTRGWRYRSVGGQRYSLDEVPPRPPGTTVRLELRDEAAHLAEAGVLRLLTTRYAALLPVPLRVGADEQPVNAELPLWRVPTDGAALEHPVQGRRRRMAFASRFDPLFEPLLTIDLVPTGESDAWGLIWAQDGATFGSSDNRCVSLFSRGMLVTDDARHLLPRWAGFCGAVVESARVNPTAAREDVQRDEAWVAVREAVAQRLVHGLAEIAAREPATWRRLVARHNEALLGAAVCDERLFSPLAEILTVPTTAGDLTADEILAGGGGVLHVASAERGGFEEMVCRAQGIPVALGGRYGVLSFLRRWARLHGTAVVELGTVAGDARLFRRVDVDDGVLTRLAAGLAADGEHVVAAAFEPASLPLVPVPDREAELKRRLEADEADERIGAATLALARLHTAALKDGPAVRLYVNLANAAVRQLATGEGGAGRDDAFALLRTVKTLLAAAGSTGDGAAVAPTFGELTAVLCRLLDTGPGTVPE